MLRFFVQKKKNLTKKIGPRTKKISEFIEFLIK